MENNANTTLSYPPFKGLAMTSEQPPLLNGMHPGFFPNEASFILSLNLNINFYMQTTIPHRHWYHFYKN